MKEAFRRGQGSTEVLSPIEAPPDHVCHWIPATTNAHSLIQNRSNNLSILPDLHSNRISILPPIIPSDILGRFSVLQQILCLTVFHFKMLFFLRYCAVLISGCSSTRNFKHIFKMRKHFSNIRFRMVNYIVSILLVLFHVMFFQVFVVFISMYVFFFSS